MNGLMLAAWLLCGPDQAVQVPPQTPGTVAPKPPADPHAKSGTIRGRILGPTGRPLRGARVEALPTEVPRYPRVASTDIDGRYEIALLEPNSYMLSASKPGYVGLELGQRRAFEHGQPITLGAGETLEKVDLTLPRGGAIAGRIVDENGDSVEGVGIQIMQIQFANGHRQLLQLTEIRARTTNDVGRYRVYGLQPGQYVVTATAAMPATAKLSDYAPTYFPGTPAASEAQLVSVGIAEEVLNADFTLAQVRAARVSGAVVDSSGQPSRANLILATSQRSGTLSAMPIPGGIRSDGSFEISNVAPGEYVLQAFRPRPSPTAEAEFAMQYVTVADKDVTNLALRTSLGSTVSGRTIVEGGTDLKPADVRILPEPVDFDRAPMVGFGFAGQVRDDWTFEMQGLSGPRLFRVGVPTGWALKAVRSGGVDITDTPTPLGTKDQSVGDLEIVVTKQMTDITGTVTDARRQPVSDYTAIVFSPNSQRWYRFSRYLGFARADRSGAFHVRGLAPGEYYVAAVDWMQGTISYGEWQDPAFLSAIAPKATKVTLADGQAVSVAVKLIVR